LVYVPFGLESVLVTTHVVARELLPTLIQNDSHVVRCVLVSMKQFSAHSRDTGGDLPATNRKTQSTE
jgi:hypothetical protein